MDYTGYGWFCRSVTHAGCVQFTFYTVTLPLPHVCTRTHAFVGCLLRFTRFPHAYTLPAYRCGSYPFFTALRYHGLHGLRVCRAVVWLYVHGWLDAPHTCLRLTRCSCVLPVAPHSHTITGSTMPDATRSHAWLLLHYACFTRWLRTLVTTLLRLPHTTLRSHTLVRLRFATYHGSSTRYLLHCHGSTRSAVCCYTLHSTPLRCCHWFVRLQLRSAALRLLHYRYHRLRFWLLPLRTRGLRAVYVCTLLRSAIRGCWFLPGCCTFCAVTVTFWFTVYALHILRCVTHSVYGYARFGYAARLPRDYRCSSLHCCVYAFIFTRYTLHVPALPHTWLLHRVADLHAPGLRSSFWLYTFHTRWLRYRYRTRLHYHTFCWFAFIYRTRYWFCHAFYVPAVLPVAVRYPVVAFFTLVVTLRSTLSVWLRTFTVHTRSGLHRTFVVTFPGCGSRTWITRTLRLVTYARCRTRSGSLRYVAGYTFTAFGWLRARAVCVRTRTPHTRFCRLPSVAFYRITYTRTPVHVPLPFATFGYLPRLLRGSAGYVPTLPFTFMPLLPVGLVLPFCGSYHLCVLRLPHLRFTAFTTHTVLRLRGLVLVATRSGCRCLHVPRSTPHVVRTVVTPHWLPVHGSTIPAATQFAVLPTHTHSTRFCLRLRFFLPGLLPPHVTRLRTFTGWLRACCCVCVTVYSTRRLLHRARLPRLVAAVLVGYRHTVYVWFTTLPVTAFGLPFGCSRVTRNLPRGYGCRICSYGLRYLQFPIRLVHTLCWLRLVGCSALVTLYATIGYISVGWLPTHRSGSRLRSTRYTGYRTLVVGSALRSRTTGSWLHVPVPHYVSYRAVLRLGYTGSVTLRLHYHAVVAVTLFTRCRAHAARSHAFVAAHTVYTTARCVLAHVPVTRFTHARCIYYVPFTLVGWFTRFCTVYAVVTRYVLTFAVTHVPLPLCPVAATVWLRCCHTTTLLVTFAFDCPRYVAPLPLPFTFYACCAHRVTARVAYVTHCGWLLRYARLPTCHVRTFGCGCIHALPFAWLLPVGCYAFGFVPAVAVTRTRLHGCCVRSRFGLRYGSAVAVLWLLGYLRLYTVLLICPLPFTTRSRFTTHTCTVRFMPTHCGWIHSCVTRGSPVRSH